jgi:steroid delta-isomerase-like uncharacterized protein
MGHALDTIRRFYERFNDNDLDGAVELFKPDLHSFEPAAGLLEGAEAWRAYGEAYKAAMPDARLELDSAVEEEQTVAVQGRFTGTHTGALQSPQGEVPASGNRVELAFADFFRLEDGKVAEHRVYFDQLDLMAQLGLQPTGASA